MTAEEHQALVDQAMKELGLCGCGDPNAVLVFLLDLLEQMTIPHLERTHPDVREWSQRAFRPCCGTCREPMNRVVGPCVNCGDPWSGAEASQREAFHRVSKQPSTAGRTLGLYVLDNLDMTEHGGSVEGGWLSTKGLDFLLRYRRLIEQDVE